MIQFGLSNVPTAFMDLMNEVLKSFLDQFMVVFIEDILLYSESQEEHEEHLVTMLEALRHQKLFAKFKKCDFWIDHVSFLGHVISKEGVSADPQKVKAIA